METKIGDKFVFLGYVLNNDVFKVDADLTKYKTYMIERDFGNVNQITHLWIKNDKNSIGGYIPSNEGGYYNFCSLKEYRKQKINRINAKFRNNL